MCEIIITAIDSRGEIVDKFTTNDEYSIENTIDGFKNDDRVVRVVIDVAI